MITPASVFYPTKSAGGFNAGGSIYLEKTSQIYTSTVSTGTLSMWVQPTTVDGDILSGGNSGGSGVDTFIVSRQSSKFFIEFVGPGGEIFVFQTSNTYTNNNWYQILASWNTNFTTGNKLSHLYINDISDKTVSTDTGGAFSTVYNNADLWDIGLDQFIGTGGPYVGNLSEVYFCPGTYLDLSILANRRKFISATKRPIFLGTNGSVPTTAQPALYLKGQGTGFNINSGAGGNFTTTGTLTIPTTTPSAP